MATHADANGRTTTVVRDGFGRETSRTTPDGVTIATAYTRCGPCPKVGAVAPVMAVVERSPIAPDTTRYLDMLGRTIRTQTVSFDGAAQRTVDVAYDAQGRVASVSDPYHATATPSLHRTTYAYDHRDRVTQEGRAGGGSVATAYARQGNGVRATRTETVATAGSTATTARVKTSDYNALGELVRTTDAAGTTAAVTTAYAYDTSGLLQTVTVDGARKTVFGHDAAGNRTSVSSPNFGTVTFAHTALGELRTRTDAKSRQTAHAYDRLGRLLTATDADGESRWVYDGANGKGLPARRCRSATANANCARVGEYRETFAWNADARLSKRTTEIGQGALAPRVFVHGYGYLGDGDANVHDGRLATVSYPAGLKVRREYNARGYLAKLVDAASNTALETYDDRDAYGNVLTETYGNGTETTRTFETGSARPSGVKTVRGTTTLQDSGYRWRSDGILAERTAPGLVETFAHDGLNRLLTATAKRSNSSADLRKLTTAYGTDRLGNYTALESSVTGDPDVTGIGYGKRTNTAAPGPDAVTAATVGGMATTLSYDAAGHVTRYDRKTGDDRFVVWDARNLAASVTEGASATATSPTAREEFRYGPSGARYQRTSTWQPPAGALGGTATRVARTFYAGAFEETAVVGGNTATVVSRTRVSDNVVHERRVTRTNDVQAVSVTYEYLHRDHLGSVETVSGANGGAVHRLAYDPYGARRAADWSRSLTDAESAALGAVRPRGFTGHEHLDRVGLIHANGRLYDPRLGRYLSPDPAVSDPTHGQSWNGYAYVGNSPLSFTDPTGTVRAGPGCNVGGVMCLDDGGGGHSDAPATYPQPYSYQVTIPVVMPFSMSVWGGGFFSSGGLPGEGGFGGLFGWFSPPAISYASINVRGVLDRSTGVDGRGPGDRPAPLFTSPTIGFIVSVGVGVLPGAGSVQSVVELATGYDYITGDEVHRGIALIGIAAGFAPGGKAALKVATKATDVEDILVIGRLEDLKDLRPGERTLLDLLPHQGNDRANWEQNSRVLREEMSKVSRIRDASRHEIDPKTGKLPRTRFLGAERNLLEYRGWRFDKESGYWIRK